jgi:hypothetical protein
MSVLRRNTTRCDRCNRRVFARDEETQDGAWFVFPLVKDPIGYVCQDCKPSMEATRPFTDDELAEAEVVVTAVEHGHEPPQIEHADRKVAKKVMRAANLLHWKREMERGVKRRRAAEGGAA